MKSKIDRDKKINRRFTSKQIITIFIGSMVMAILFMPHHLGAQTPEQMSYQAVIRDSANELVTNTEVGMQISILQGSILEVVYQETQTPTTNANGLVSVEIGAGTTSDDFTAIDWANGPYFIKTETDPTGGTNYSITGTSQLMSVPYALYAKESGSSTSPNLQTVLAENNSANNQQIKNLQDPTDDQDAVTKAYTFSKTEVDVLMNDLLSEINYIIPPPYPDGTVHCDPDNPTKVVDVTNPITGKTWMDRNLGASRAATSINDTEAYGDLYQWGRGADGHQCRDSETTITLSSTDQPGHGDFILTTFEGPDTISYYDWRNPQNDNLWQGENGVNSPCPSGYRVPSYAELGAERQSWVSDDPEGAFASTLKLPMAGRRGFETGSIDFSGSGGNYWSSMAIGDLARSLNLVNNFANMSFNYKASGFSVRCIKDEFGKN